MQIINKGKEEKVKLETLSKGMFFGQQELLDNVKYR